MHRTWVPTAIETFCLIAFTSCACYQPLRLNNPVYTGWRGNLCFKHSLAFGNQQTLAYILWGGTHHYYIYYLPLLYLFALDRSVV